MFPYCWVRVFFSFQMLFLYFDFQWFDSHFPIHPMSDIDEIMKMFYYLDMKISIRKPHDETKRIIVLCLLMPKWIVYIAKCASHFPNNSVHKNTNNACWFGFFFHLFRRSFQLIFLWFILIISMRIHQMCERKYSFI